MEFIDIFIYILACFGLFFTMISIFQSYNYFPCCIQKLKEENNNEIIIKIKVVNQCDIDNILQKIKIGNYDNIYDIADEVKIIKCN